MPILEQKDEKMVAKLKNFLENSEYANFYQSFEYAKTKQDKWKNEYVYLEENGQIIAAMLVQIRTIAKLFTIMYAPRGPVADVYNMQIMKQLEQETRPLAKKYKAFVLKMAPEVTCDEKLAKTLRQEGFKVTSIFKNILKPMQTVKNMILEVEGKTKEELMAVYSQKTRYNIKLAQKKGVTVRYSSQEEDIKKFYELMKVTAIRDGIGLSEYEYFKDLIYDFKEHARIYIAEYEGQALAAALAINYGKKVTYYYGASSNEKRNLMPCYLMQQTMIDWALETGCRKYDFGGVFNTTMDNGLYRFKEGFCKKEGVTCFIGEIDKIYKPFLYFLFEQIVPKAKKIMLSIHVKK